MQLLKEESIYTSVKVNSCTYFVSYFQGLQSIYRDFCVHFPIQLLQEERQLLQEERQSVNRQGELIFTFSFLFSRLKVHIHEKFSSYSSAVTKSSEKMWCFISELHPTKMKDPPAIKLRKVCLYH